MSRSRFHIIGVLMISLVGVVAAGTLRQERSAQSAVRAFAEQVEREWAGDSSQHAITAQALRLLSIALGSVANAQHSEVAADLKVLDERIHRFAVDQPDSPTQPAQLQQVFTSASTILHRLANGQAVDEENRRRLAAMQRSAESLDVKQPLRRQPDVIERFFHQAAALLRAMAQQD